MSSLLLNKQITEIIQSEHMEHSMWLLSDFAEKVAACVNINKMFFGCMMIKDFLLCPVFWYIHIQTNCKICESMFEFA